MKAIYTAAATATGGRNGHVISDNGVLDVQVRAPKAMGGANDDYTNPEQLFTAGYSACFDSALNHIIRLEKIKAGETSVTAKVSIGSIETSEIFTASSTASPNAPFSMEPIDTFAVTDVSPVFTFSCRMTWFNALSKHAE